MVLSAFGITEFGRNNIQVKQDWFRREMCMRSPRKWSSRLLAAVGIFFYTSKGTWTGTTGSKKLLDVQTVDMTGLRSGHVDNAIFQIHDNSELLGKSNEAWNRDRK